MTDTEALWALRDGHLPAEEAAALRDRLATEPALQELWATLDQVALDLADLPLDAPPAGLNEALLDRLPQAPTAAVEPPRKSARWRVVGAVLLMAGTAAASSLATLWWTRPPEAPDLPDEDAVAVAPDDFPTEDEPAPVRPEVPAPRPAAKPAEAVIPEVDLLDTGAPAPSAPSPDHRRPAPAPAPVAAYEGLPKEFVGRVRGVVTAAQIDPATGERGYWIGSPLVTAAVFRGDTACGSFEALAEAQRHGFSAEVRRCLKEVAESTEPGARRASFWLLGEAAGSDGWAELAIAHLDRWDEAPLALSLGVTLLDAGDARFARYAAEAYPEDGHTQASNKAAKRLYARWKEADWRAAPTRLSWHEAVDAAEAWWRTDRDLAGAKALWFELAARTPRPPGCTEADMRAADMAVLARCWAPIVIDDSFPDSIRAWAAPQLRVAYASLGDTDGEYAAAKAWVEADPRSEKAMLTLAGLLTDRDRGAEALELIELAEARRGASTAEMRMLRERIGEVEVAVAADPATAIATPESDDCDVLTALEPAALLGRLTDGQTRCLTDRMLDRTETDADREKACLLILADLWARNDRKGWAAGAQWFLDELRYDADLTYKLAQVQFREQRYSEAYALSGTLLDGAASPFWSGDTLDRRMYGAHKIRVAAGLKLIEDRAVTPAEVRRDAERWVRDARTRGLDDAQAVAICAQLDGDCAPAP